EQAAPSISEDAETMRIIEQQKRPIAFRQGGYVLTYRRKNSARWTDRVGHHQDAPLSMGLARQVVRVAVAKSFAWLACQSRRFVDAIMRRLIHEHRIHML